VPEHGRAHRVKRTRQAAHGHPGRRRRRPGHRHRDGDRDRHRREEVAPFSSGEGQRPTAPPDPSVSLTKTAAVSPAANQDGARLGDTISYSYLVTNTGNVTLALVEVTDPSIGAVHCPTPAAPGLAPGASVTCQAEGSPTVTDADVVAGAVTDVATATGTDTHGTPSDPSAPATATVATRRGPMVSIVKRASVSSLADLNRAKLGDTIAYL
jgi:septal ring-binding cell division protein DamX